MNISESAVSFKEIERTTQKLVNQYGCFVLKMILEKWDSELMESRDKKQYRHHGKKRTVIKTVMGEIEYLRTEYQTTIDGKTKFVYLLDEAMGELGSGYFSELFSELIVEACCVSSYRDAARAVSEMTGQTISHMAAWTVVQTFGTYVDEAEHRAAELAAAKKGAGTLEAKVLFEEQDGIYLSLQGKDRKKYGDIKEMKVSIAYDGAKKVGKERYELTNKVACANFEGAKKFVSRKDGIIASTYNVDEIDMRILGGDGARWIRRSQKKGETTYFQLDSYHRNRAILQYISDPEVRKTILELLYKKQIDLMLEVIEAYSKSVEDKAEIENSLKLYDYFVNNKEGLVAYHRRDIDLPEPPEGKTYRRLGAMESNVFTIIGNRMKGRRACWSIKGGNNLARMLCLKHTNRLREVLDSLSVQSLPDKYTEEILTIDFSAAKSPERVGKGYDGYRSFSVPNSMPWLKDIARIRTVVPY